MFYYDSNVFCQIFLAEHSVANHQSWLLKTVAIELRVTTLNRQRSHTQRLMKLILDDYDEEQTSGKFRDNLYEGLAFNS